MSFDQFGLSEPVAESLRRQGFSDPTPIQDKALPPLLQGRDLLGRAETGSGKTLAFGIPLIEKIEGGRVSIQALVVCPTRELASQVAEDLAETGKEKGIRVALVVGGVHVRTQRMQIPGCQVVVGTPGRIVDLLEDRFLPVEWVEYFVLDEFDRLLEMGFIEDIRRIAKRLPKERQTVLFSATVPKQIMDEAHAIMKNPVLCEIGDRAINTVSTLEQRAIRCPSSKKLMTLEKLLDHALDEDGTVIVFCNTKKQVRQVDRELWAKDYSVAALSGDHDQSVRFKVMERFRNREIRVLVATDVAARGLDIDHVGLVINYDVPSEVEDYVHRIGRTARAGRDGIVISFVGSEDRMGFQRIQKRLGDEIRMVPLEAATARLGSTAGGSDAPSRATPPIAESAPSADPADAAEQPSPEEVFGANIDIEEPAPETADTPRTDSPSAGSRRGEDRDGEGGGSRRRRSRGRGRGRGRGRSGSASDDSKADKAEKADKAPEAQPGNSNRSKRSGGRNSNARRKSPKTDDTSSSRKPRGRNDSRGSRRGRDSGNGDRKEPERPNSSRRRGGSRRRENGRRREERELDKPVELMEDNWGHSDDLLDTPRSRSHRREDDPGNRPVVEGTMDMAIVPQDPPRPRRRRSRGSSRRRGSSGSSSSS